MNKNLETKRLLLIASNQNLLESAIEGDKKLSQQLGVIVPENWTEFGLDPLQYALDKIKSSKEELGWWNYFVIHKSDNKLIGNCGYSGQPTEEGIVEIGYEIKSEYRNKGLATELANTLIDNAFSFEHVNSIQAHTLGQENPSTKVLSKCNFQKIEELEDEAEGIIWKWKLQRT
ncbi:GNAT family N-acetyltransferase [Bernardetia sp. Wsw4-3y2]|uniref:GNAT family N-acetyltransferase n=1 Tax=Bernardetia sp. Wsw4-3y2 TaxID=3127471 RepID=UPI0030D16C4A